MATGVDRVELAYLDYLTQDDTPVLGIVRTPLGYLLLDRAGMVDFRNRLQGVTAWGRLSLLSRFGISRPETTRRAESALRRLSVARCTRRGLPRMLRHHFSGPFEYFNVGHSNLTDRMLRGVKASGGRVNVLIHDVIPLEHPQFQRPETLAPFRGKIMRVSAMADHVIYNSHDTQQRAEIHMAQMGRVPAGTVAHLGVSSPHPDPSALPTGLPSSGPYFVTVGTIEPRKNHALLLDIWDMMGPDAPPLFICGSRGWNNDPVFARLDALPPDSLVREYSGLSDPALAALVQGARALLFPSIAEGFGLPPVEALMLKTRVLCNDLAVLQEILGPHAAYASITDANLWLDKVKEWTEASPETRALDDFAAPSWSDHFKTVLRLT